MKSPEQLLEIILSNTYSRQSLKHRLNLTREFLEFHFFSPHENQNLIYLLNRFVDQKKEGRDEFNALYTWGNDFFDSLKRENFYDYLEKISQAAREIPEAILYLPFMPPIYEEPKLCGWFRENVKPRFLISVKFNRNLIGGCALVWKGVYYDFSLRYYLTKSRVTIKKVVEEYLRNGN